MGKAGHKRVRQRETVAYAGRPPPAPAAPVTAWAPRWMNIGVGLLFLVACAFGVLEVHSSNDTWIALAAGRQICSEPEFPKADTFSYTFHGQTWYNQNWLSHVYFWLLYDKLGPNAVVYGTWALGVGIFTFSLLATRLRTGSWLVGVLGGALVGLASRDWLSARPATVQFFLLSLLWLALSGLMSQTNRRRWWPIILLTPIFSCWPHAHGSFPFGYGLVGMLLVCNALTWLVGQYYRQVAPPISGVQAIAVVVIGLVTAVLGVALSPYGLENYTHPVKVVESPVFRQIGEWIPPYLQASYPPVERFWAAVVVAAVSPLTAIVLRAISSGARPARPHPGGPSPAGQAGELSSGWSTGLFDVAAVGLGLLMALWARRFAPVFYILATPTIAAWTLRLGKMLSPHVRRRAQDLVVLLSWPAVVLAVYVTFSKAHADLVAAFPANGGYDLLDRVTRMDATPRLGMEFLRRNSLKPNVMTEWTLAGPIMFLVPGARVYIDGRSQQVYTEKHYLSYNLLLNFPDGDEAKVSELLAHFKTDAVLLRRNPAVFRLSLALERQPTWKLVLEAPREMMLARVGSPLLEELARRERDGSLWWPDLPHTDYTRGILLAETEPRDPERAVALWQSAVARDPMLGYPCYWRIATTLASIGRTAEAQAYLRSERQRLSTSGELTPAESGGLLREIQRCEGLLAIRPPPATRPTGQ